MRQLSVEDLQRRYAAGERMTLLDVREPFEVEAADLPYASLKLRMHDVPRRFNEVPRDATVVVYCHLGVRSERVAEFLEAQGFADVANLDGGIDAWSLRVDPNVPRY